MRANIGFCIGLGITFAALYFKMHWIIQGISLFMPFVGMWMADGGFGGGDSDFMANDW